MKASVYDIVTDRILAKLAEGTVPWRKRWNGSASTELPRNFLTKKAYRGINVILLWSCGYSTPDFLTFNQAKSLGGSVRKGEHGMPIVFWTVYDGKNSQTGASEKRFVLKYFTVFHVSQCDGLDVPAPVVDPNARHVDPIEACERVVASYANPPAIRHGGDGAFYRPSTDSVQMPERNAFDGAEEYYSTLFHELGHSTGHASRLARKAFHERTTFGSHSYSFEELVAEMTAAFLCCEAGIDTTTIDNSAAYIANWVKVLKSEPRWVVDAASQAAKAADLILGRKASYESDESNNESAAAQSAAA